MSAPRLPRFGRDIRGLWHLAPDATFLNHGSYGACPRPVLAEQERLRLEMESHPDRFFRKGIMPREEGTTPLREAIAPLARFVGAEANAIAFIENVTSGVQAVLRSVPLARGDEVLITDHTYNAVRLIVEARCAETGARPRLVTLGLCGSADEIVERFRAALTPQVRLAIVDHITSATALAHPVARIAAELRRFDAKVLVDGAHGVGQVPLDLASIDADWYVSNAHKWLFAPKGTAFLHAGPRVRTMTAPLVVSHFVEMGFPRSFDYVATRDYTGWLAIPEALRFFESLGPEEARAWHARLIDRATALMRALGAEPVGSEELACSMRSFVLPQSRPATTDDAMALATRLWQRDRIQSMAVAFGDKLLLRVSAQAYVDEHDLQQLADALERDGWPGR
jgi:isopenicillin-N epimerase